MSTWADNLLAKCQLDRAAVRRALPRTVVEFAVSAEPEIRAAARARKKGAQPGDGRLPRWVVVAMWRDYQRTRSARAVGQLYGRAANTVLGILRRHGFAIAPARRPRGQYRVPHARVLAMHATYLRLGSLESAAKLYGRTNQALSTLFARHGLATLPRKGRRKLQLVAA